MAKLPTVRTWAKSQGMEIGNRGVIAQDIKDAYAKANARALKAAMERKDRDAERVALAREVSVATIREFFTPERQEKAGIQVGARGRLTDEVYLAYALAKRLGQSKGKKTADTAA